ncbi:MAG: hypothetical protein LBP65_01530 [Puniceicoccales bacterium]|nr:hypothetical protein [Puniceicoccales bacterium]
MEKKFLYRHRRMGRMDEVGTPFAITVDRPTLLFYLPFADARRRRRGSMSSSITNTTQPFLQQNAAPIRQNTDITGLTAAACARCDLITHLRRLVFYNYCRNLISAFVYYLFAYWTGLGRTETFYTGLVAQLSAHSTATNANTSNSDSPSTEAHSSPAALNGQQAAEVQSIVEWIPAEQDDSESGEGPTGDGQPNRAEVAPLLLPPPPLSEVDENLIRWKELNDDLCKLIKLYYVDITPGGVDKDLYKKYMYDLMIDLTKNIEVSKFALPNVHRKNIENFLKKCMEAFKLMVPGLKKLGTEPDPDSKEIKLVNDLQAIIATLSAHLTSCEDAAATGLRMCGAQLKIFFLRIQGSDTPMKARITALCECIIPDAVGHAIARILSQKKGTTAPAEILELESLIINVLANLQLPWKTELSPMRYCGCAIDAANLLTSRCPFLLESQRGGEFTGKDGVGVTFEMHLMQILTALGATNIPQDAMCAIRAIIRLVLQEITPTKLSALLTSFSGIEEILCEGGNDAWENLKFSNDLLHTLVGVLVAYPASETGKTWPLPAGTTANSLINQFQGQSLRQVRDTLETQDSGNPIMYALASPEAVRIFNQYCVQITLDAAPEFKKIIENIPVPFKWQNAILKPEVVAPAATTHQFGNHFHYGPSIPYFNEFTTGTVEVVVALLAHNHPAESNLREIREQRLLIKKQEFLNPPRTEGQPSLEARIAYLEKESKCCLIAIGGLLMSDSDILESFPNDFRASHVIMRYCTACWGNVLNNEANTPGPHTPSNETKLVRATRDLFDAFQTIAQFQLEIHSNRDICPERSIRCHSEVETDESRARTRTQIILRHRANVTFCTLCLEFYSHLVRNGKTNVANALFRTPNIPAIFYSLPIPEYSFFSSGLFHLKEMKMALFGRCIQIIPNVFWEKIVDSLKDDEFLSLLGDSVDCDDLSVKTPYLAFLLFHIASEEKFPMEYKGLLCYPFGKSSFQMAGTAPARDKLAGAQVEEQLFKRLERLTNKNNNAVAQLLKKLLCVVSVIGGHINERDLMDCDTCWVGHTIDSEHILLQNTHTIFSKYCREIHFSITPYAYKHLLPLMIKYKLLRPDGNGNYIDDTNRVWRFVAIPAMVSLSTGHYIHIEAGPAIMDENDASRCWIERRIALCHTEHGSLPTDEPVTFLDANGSKISL